MDFTYTDKHTHTHTNTDDVLTHHMRPWTSSCVSCSLACRVVMLSCVSSCRALFCMNLCARLAYIWVIIVELDAQHLRTGFARNCLSITQPTTTPRHFRMLSCPLYLPLHTSQFAHPLRWRLRFKDMPEIQHPFLPAQKTKKRSKYRLDYMRMVCERISEAWLYSIFFQFRHCSAGIVCPLMFRRFIAVISERETAEKITTSGHYGFRRMWWPPGEVRTLRH